MFQTHPISFELILGIQNAITYLQEVNMKPMKLNELVKLLESNGFVLIRSSGHLVYAKGPIRLALAHQRVVSPGVMREAMKALKTSQVPMTVQAA